jgi:hypothetical protein
MIAKLESVHAVGVDCTVPGKRARQSVPDV